MPFFRTPISKERMIAARLIGGGDGRGVGIRRCGFGRVGRDSNPGLGQRRAGAGAVHIVAIGRRAGALALRRRAGTRLSAGIDD